MLDLNASEAFGLGLIFGMCFLPVLTELVAQLRLLIRRRNTPVVHLERPVWRVQRRVLALYNDGSGLWGVGESEEQAIAEALASWHSYEPPEGCDYSDEEWTAGLHLVVVSGGPDAVQALIENVEGYTPPRTAA